MSDDNLTTTDEGDVDFPPFLILFIVLQQVVFSLSCFSNIVVIFIFTRYLHLRSFKNRFVVGLAAADFCTGVSVGSQIIYFLFPELNAVRVACFIRYQIVAFLTMTSQLTASFTTFDRYIAICHPHSYSKVVTNVTANILVTLPWVYALVLTSLSFLGLKSWSDDSMYCLYHLIFEQGVYLASALTTVCFSVASLIMYIRILQVAWKYYNRIRPSNETSPYPQVRKKSTERNVRSAKVMGIVTAAFTICWTPFTAYQFRYGVGSVDLTMDDINVSNWLVFLGMTNSLVNPVIYAWQRKDFNTVCKKLCGRNVDWSNATADFTSHVSST
ncbi:mu-type opioid receptor-like [Mizuhopecten yessoensis]|uniref:Mu-type opioid receptor n=1 Tax=Mizuhopecten yessoensis TaxID=6573 RepID=A0A210QQ78_MIZYE|nr:mu-type opioid receptor-like [Mizuhopecten yessoensis]OWF50891.1 Mu-type opioid receptor [Mizuhopecten yessoensis]